MKTNEIRAHAVSVAEIIDAQKGVPVTIVIANGAGEFPATVAELASVLESQPLDRSFERFGNFIEADPVGADDRPLYPNGFVSFFGNFRRVSHVFNIVTNEPEVIRELTRQIRANQQRPDYRAQTDRAPRIRAA